MISLTRITRVQSVCVVVVGLLSILTVQSAGASEVPERPPETLPDAPFRTEMKERREQYTSSVGTASSSSAFKERVVERRAIFAAGVKERMKNLLDNVTARLTAIVERFAQISNRIESRVVKLEAEGADGTAVREALGRVRESLSRAEQSIALLNDSSIDRVVDDTLPRDRFTELREAIVTIHDELRAAHAALKDALIALRATTAPLAPTPADTQEIGTTTSDVLEN